MIQQFDYINHSTRDGTPAGGEVTMYVGPHDSVIPQEAPVLLVRWQNGPLVVDGERHEANGCFVETLIEVAKMRLEYYQTTKFNCVENAEMIGHLGAALEAAQDRTRRREARGVEGTSTV